MPSIPRKFWETIPLGSGLGALMERGRRRMNLFCLDNNLPVPDLLEVTPDKWHVHACAYYRPQYIKICLTHCGHPCGDHDFRNWTYPGNTTDREPYGVVLHELGHHVDWLAGDRKNHDSYFSEYGVSVCKESREDPISGYHDNEAEWFAEMFRVFATNPDLLRLLRPRTHRILTRTWKPVTSKTWVEELGPNCPYRVIRSLEKKIRGRR